MRKIKLFVTLIFVATSVFASADKSESAQAQDFKLLKALQSGNAKDLSQSISLGANPNSRFCTDNSDVNVQLKSLSPCINGLPPLWFILRRPESQQLALISVLAPSNPQWGMEGEDVLSNHILLLNNLSDQREIQNKIKIGRLLIDNGLTVDPEWLKDFAENLELNNAVGSNSQKIALLKAITQDTSLSDDLNNGIAKAQSKIRIEHTKIRQAKEAAEVARKQVVERNLNRVKTIGTPVCRLAKAGYITQWGEVMGKPMYSKPESRIFSLSGITEQVSESKIQIRIKSIKMHESNKFVDVEKVNNELQVNSLLWDDPSLWRACGSFYSSFRGN